MLPQGLEITKNVQSLIYSIPTAIELKLKNIWVGGKVGNGEHDRYNCLTHRSHDQYPGPSGMQ